MNRVARLDAVNQSCASVVKDARIKQVALAHRKIAPAVSALASHARNAASSPIKVPDCSRLFILQRNLENNKIHIIVICEGLVGEYDFILNIEVQRVRILIHATDLFTLN